MSAKTLKAGETLVEPLTRREREVLILLAQGYSAPEIAGQLTLALSSVKWYVQQVYGKLGVNNKQRAIIRAGELGLLEAPSPVVTINSSPKHNLPSQLTSFIGHEKEIETVKRLIILHGGSRLLTLTGAGGSGKTRLALEVAAKLCDIFPDCVWFIQLAPLSNPALVPQTVMLTLGLHEDANRSALTSVSDFLQPKQALIVLDNCEHLIQACAELAETLLHSCPTLHILATSRETLGIAGETPYLVPTLTTPNPAHAKLETLPQYESVQLFVERTQTALPGFALTKDNAPAVAEVCYQLDGIPLALELAAARVKALRVEQIAMRLEDRFDLLTGGSRTALPRHQTLHALIDWSHDLLQEPERVLLRRLSVFAGGWTLEAAETICAGEGVEVNAVLDLMTHLVKKSLVISERKQGEEARYRMLETVRQYATQRLLNANETEQLRNRHRDFFLHWAELAEPQLHGPLQLEWLDRLETELDNLRAALEWSLAVVEYGGVGLRLASALLAFWRQRGHVREGRSWLANLLTSQTAPIASATRAKALHAAGYLARWQGDVATSRAQLEESEILWRALGSIGQIGLAYSLATLSDTMQQFGDPAKARSLAGEAVELFRGHDERWGLAYSLLSLGLALRDQEDFSMARSVLNESVALWQELGDLWGLRLAYNRLGMVAMREGDYEVARFHFANDLTVAKSLGDAETIAIGFLDVGLATINLGDRAQAKVFFEECFRLFRESGNQFGIAFCYYYFGYLAQFEGDNQAAQTFFKQELALARTTGPLWLRSQALFGLAGVAAANGQALRAARLLGAADARAEAAATYTDAADALYQRHTINLIAAQIDKATFEQVRADGRRMTFEQAADYALLEASE